MKTTNQKNNNLVQYLVLAAILVAVLYFGLSGSQVQQAASQNQGEGSAMMIGYNSAVCKEVIRADGAHENLGCRHNLFTNYGKNITRDLLGSYSNLAAVTAIGLANNTSAPAATDVVLSGEYTACGMSRAAGTYNIQSASHGNWSVSKVFTSTCDSVVLVETGLYNSTSGNTLFAETGFTNATLQTNDQINITWFIWVT